jgi:SSS family solute:Na+ symporter
VNGPLFATFLLGMFWKRTTGHGAFWGLVAGTLAAAVTHGVTVAEGKGGWITEWYEVKSGMGQAFIVASVSWVFNFFTTILVSLVTKPKPEEELKGLVYSLTPRQKAENQPWYLRAAPLGLILLAITIILNIIFF